MRSFVGAVAVIAGLAGAAQAEEAGRWRGAWRVDGTTRVRTVVGDDAGRVAVDVEVDGDPVRCEGPETPTGLGLTGSPPASRGLAGALRGDRGPEGPAAVRLEVRPELDAKDGQVAAVAVLFRGVRELWRERWTRPGPAGLQVVQVRHPKADGGYAPVDGPLELLVRVLGRAQEVSVHVVDAPGADDPRPAFYGVELVRRGLGIASFGGARLEPGLHTLTWSGRDGTKDERLALAGDYRLRVDSPERRAAAGPRGEAAPEARVHVARPRAAVHGPFGPGAAPAARALEGGYLVRRHAGLAGPAALDDLRGSALALFDTHGGKTGFRTGAGDDDFVNRARLDGARLGDVHAVFITACESGHWGRNGLPGDLISAGVDVVVAMDAPIVAREADQYHEALAPRLLRYGAPLERVVQEAAHESTGRYWGFLGEHDQLRAQALVDAAAARALRQLARARKIEEVVGVFCAPGIDPQTETLMPPRHGCSTN